MNFKLLVTDLDGTLLNSTNEIGEDNKNAIWAAARAGVKTVICSGRPFVSIKTFEEELGTNRVDDYGICFNGGMIYKTLDHRIIYESRLDWDTALFLIRELKKAGVSPLVYIGAKLYAEKETEMLTLYTNRTKMKVDFVEDLAALSQDVSKVLIREPYEVLVEVEKLFAEKIQNRCNMFFTEKTLLEFTSLTTDKGRAVTHLAKYLGLSMDQVIAVGDNLNDLSMIETAGLGVAVQNAEPRAKAKARYVTAATNNQAAIKEVVERFILGPAGLCETDRSAKQ